MEFSWAWNQDGDKHNSGNKLLLSIILFNKYK